MNTPPKYEDLVLKVAEMDRRETALRESLTDKRDEYNKLGDSYDALQQRLTVAEQRVQRMVECSKGQDSVATGYLSDILALLKPAAEHQGEPVMPGSEEFSHMSTIELRGYHAGWHAACMQNRSAEQPAPVAFVIDIESAAKKLAQCMDYPWEYMPEQGRQSMREHAKAVVEASRLNGVKP